jgi:hypothetical protein
VGKGPALKLTHDKANSIKSISLRVKSLRTAKKFLKANGLLGEEKESMLTLHRGKVNDLDIRLVK